MSIFKRKNTEPYIQILNNTPISKERKKRIISIMKDCILKQLSKLEMEAKILSSLNISSHVYVYNYPNQKKYYVVI